MPTPDKPLISNRYTVEIDGLELAEFTEVSGVSVEVPAVEQIVSVGDGRTELRSFPGNVSYGDITLKVGRADASELYDWLQQVVDKKFTDATKTGAICQKPVDPLMDPIERWNFKGAWPSKWELGELKAGANTVNVESLTIKVEEIWKDEA